MEEWKSVLKLLAGIWRTCRIPFIISEALRYDVKGRKYIGTGTKYYFEDIGIRNAVVDFRQIEFTHIMENVVYNELRKQGYTVDVGSVESFKRDENGKLQRRNLEIDFVVNRHDERLYIQSAYALPDKEKGRTGAGFFFKCKRWLSQTDYCRG